MCILCCVRFMHSLQKEAVNLTKIVPGFNRWIGWWWKRNKWGGFHTSSLHLLFLSPCSSHLSSYISSHLSVVSPPDNILPSVSHSALLSRRLVAVQIKAWQRIIMCKNIVEYSGSSNIEKVRRPAEMSSPQSVRFPLAFVSVGGFSVHWVHTVFHRVLQPCQEKCLVVNKHQTRACKC